MKGKIYMEENKILIKYPIIVEGKYDKIKLSSFVEATIIPTFGFRIFKDDANKALIKGLAKRYKNIIVFTDSDTAGLVIRNYLKNFLHSFNMECNIINIFTPQLYGKESRKSQISKEGYLGVEGVDKQIIIGLFEKHRLLSEEGFTDQPRKKITKTDFYLDGLSGSNNSSSVRSFFLKELELPNYLSANALLELVNSIMSYEEYKNLVAKLQNDYNNKEYN